jgi:hypothetical protein
LFLYKNDNLVGMNFIIYALLCPKCKCPRYIGQSSKGLKRYKDHLLGIKNIKDGSTHKKFWIQSLLNSGLKPELKILLQLPTSDYLDEAEIYWIAEMRNRGCPLTNLTDGGKGRRGWIPSKETRSKISLSNGCRKPKSVETRAKISASLMGRPSPKKGRPLNEQQKLAHAQAHAIKPFKDQHGRIYTSIKEVAEMWGLQKSNICNVLKRKRKSAGGLIFSFLE